MIASKVKYWYGAALVYLLPSTVTHEYDRKLQ